jgi:hypothetical protein
MRRIAIGTVIIALLVVGGAYLYLQAKFRVDVPEYQAPPEKLVRVEQGWTADQRLHFRHTPQGTRLVPYDWFMALEQPPEEWVFWPGAKLSVIGGLPVSDLIRQKHVGLAHNCTWARADSTMARECHLTIDEIDACPV